MNVEVIKSYDDFKRYRDAWNSLIDHSVNSVVYLTFEWLSTWWEFFGCDHLLLVLLVRHENRIIAAAPLMIKHMRIGPFTVGKRLQFIAHDISDYMDFPVAEQPEACYALIFRRLQELQPLWDYAEFIFIPENSPYADIWKKHIADWVGFRTIMNQDSHAYALCMDRHAAGWADMEKQLTAKRRNDLKRCAKLLEQRAPIVFTATVQPAGIAEELEYLFVLHKDRWEAKGLKSQCHDKRMIAYYRALVLALASRGWAHAATLTHNGHRFAVALGFLFKGRYYYYMPSFMPAYRKFSPGNMLIKYLLVTFYAGSAIKIFDLLRGDEAYKMMWSNEKVGLFRFKIFPLKPRSIVLYCMLCARQLFRPKKTS